MKKILAYLFSVLFALLLAFACIGAVCSVIARYQIMEAKTCKKIIASQELAQVVSGQLTTYFQQQENTTGIPFSVYEKHISPEAVEPIITATVENGFSYLNGRDAALSIKKKTEEAFRHG